MQNTPPRDIFNAKKIILKLDLFMQSLKKIGKEMTKMESENPIYYVNQGPQLCSYLSKFIYLQYKATTFQYQLLYKVWRKSIKNAKDRENSNGQSRAITLYIIVKIYPSAIPEHSFTISNLMPSLKKIGKGMPKIESENQFLTSIKGRNSVLICQN